MFNGVIRASGRVVAAPSDSPAAPALAVEPETIASNDMLAAAIGDSIAVNGVCLTVARIAQSPGGWEFDIASETLRRTTLGILTAGARVNLEPSLRIGDPIDGHFLQGHVDGTVALLEVDRREPGTVRLEFELPRELSWGIAPKGSVALDGISLTVGEVGDGSFSVYIIPHTWSVTSLNGLRIGDRVNLEIDCLARYVQRILGIERRS